MYHTLHKIQKKEYLKSISHNKEEELSFLKKTKNEKEIKKLYFSTEFSEIREKCIEKIKKDTSFLFQVAFKSRKNFDLAIEGIFDQKVLKEIYFMLERGTGYWGILNKWKILAKFDDPQILKELILKFSTFTILRKISDIKILEELEEKLEKEKDKERIRKRIAEIPNSFKFITVED